MGLLRCALSPGPQQTVPSRPHPAAASQIAMVMGHRAMSAGVPTVPGVAVVSCGGRTRFLRWVLRKQPGGVAQGSALPLPLSAEHRL